jgi:hypothetical protein
VPVANLTLRRGIQAQLKAFLVNKLSRVESVLPSPAPEALVVDLGDPDAGVVKLRLTWWTKSPRQH